MTMVPAISPRIARLTQSLAAYQPKTDDDPVLRWAAVALIVVPNPDAILLIRRAERRGDPWSGHMALPGGRHAASDPTLLDTAVRETVEEVGIQLTRSQSIGALDDVAPRTPVLPPIAVRPFVFVLPDRPKLVLNAEVASGHWVPIDVLTHPNTYRPTQIGIRGTTRAFDAFHIEEAVVWGMTERILSSVLPHLG